MLLQRTNGSNGRVGTAREGSTIGEGTRERSQNKKTCKMNEDEIQKRKSAILNEFKKCTSWTERYKTIIQIGKNTPVLSEKHKTPEQLVKGCQSRVWLYASQEPETKKVIFLTDSDALITKGLAALLVKFYSGLLPVEIKDLAPSFLEDLDLKHHLSPTRVGGLFSMVKQIRYYGQAFFILSTCAKK